MEMELQNVSSNSSYVDSNASIFLSYPPSFWNQIVVVWVFSLFFASSNALPIKPHTKITYQKVSELLKWTEVTIYMERYYVRNHIMKHPL